MQRNLVLSLLTCDMPLLIAPTRSRQRDQVVRFVLPAEHPGRRAQAMTNGKPSRQRIEVK